MDRLYKSLLLFLVVFIMFAGFWIRYDDYNTWKRYKGAFFLKDRPLFTSYDSFYFGRLSEDFIKGKYKFGAVDKLRFVPDSWIVKEDVPKYPIIIPLNSFLAVIFKKLTGAKYIEQVTIWLVPLLSVLFVIPFVLFMGKLNYPSAGVIGAFLGVISQIYLFRTTIARFDTDTLNLFFPFLIGYLMLLYLNEEELKKRYLFLLAIGISCQFYWWWYFHAGLVLFSILIFLFVLLLEEGFKVFSERKRELFFFFITVNPYIIYEGVFAFVSKVYLYLINYFKPEVPTGFPNVLRSISEAKHFAFKLTAVITAGNEVVFVIGLLGIVVLLFRRFKEFLLISSAFLIGLMVLMGGNRFGMYLAPFIGAGIGTLVDEGLAFSLKRKHDFLKWKKVGAVLLSFVIVLLLFKINKPSIRYIAKPRVWPRLAGDFVKLKDITPEDAFIWTWWDFGYAIGYLSERATYHDGGSQLTPKTYFVATTFSTSDPQRAYNVIAGITKRGILPIKKLKEEKKLNPKVSERIAKEVMAGKWGDNVTHPVYWVFTADLVSKFSWINYFGTWDFRKKRGFKAGIIALGICSFNASELLCGRYSIFIDKGFLKTARGLIPLKKIYVLSGDTLKEISFNRRGVIVEIVKYGSKARAYLLGDQPFYSLFNQMYILRRYNKDLFELVYDDFPTMVVYRVKRRH